MRELKIYDEFMQDEVDTCLTIEDKNKTYPHLVDYFIRLNYSISQELAIQRQKDRKPTEYQEYDAYCERCKYKAKEILGIGGNE